jgi:hypothetical protein
MMIDPEPEKVGRGLARRNYTNSATNNSLDLANLASLFSGRERPSSQVNNPHLNEDRLD